MSKLTDALRWCAANEVTVSFRSGAAVLTRFGGNDFDSNKRLLGSSEADRHAQTLAAALRSEEEP